MRTDQYGQIVLDEQELCDLYMRDPERTVRSVLLETSIELHSDLELEAAPAVNQWHDDARSMAQWDDDNQKNWLMPEEYAQLDIAQWVLNQCSNDVELQRTGSELIEYQRRDCFDMLRYMKYLVDTMRQHNVLWGIGRGSSVASFVLYLIGVHRINSIEYDLSLDEFLK
jgi:DNA polymerase III alpha subunit